MPVNKTTSVMTGFKINGRGHKDRPSQNHQQELANFKALHGIKDPTPFDNTPDPNPVKVTKDGYGGTKLEYQARPSCPISPHVEEQEDC